MSYGSVRILRKSGTLAAVPAQKSGGCSSSPALPNRQDFSEFSAIFGGLAVHLAAWLYIWQFGCTVGGLAVHLAVWLYNWRLGCTFGGLAVHSAVWLYIWRFGALALSSLPNQTHR